MFDRVPEEPSSGSDRETDSHVSYLEAISLVEGLHRLRLEVVKDELRRLGIAGITSTQALLLFRIGHRELTAGELTSRGCYHGSNVSYTLSKLVEGGFLQTRRHAADGRAVLISLTVRGRGVRDAVAELFRRHADELDAGQYLTAGALGDLGRALRALERFMSERRLAG